MKSSGWFRRMVWGLGALLLACALLWTPRAASASDTLVVDEDGLATAADCDAVDAAFATIQSAVNAAGPGDTVYVCPGTFDEQVAISTSGLTVRGSGAGSTVIRPSAVVANSTRPSNGLPVSAIVLVTAATDVTVSSFTVDGSQADSGQAEVACAVEPFYSAVFFRESSGRIEHVHATGIQSDSVCAFALMVATDQSGVGTLAEVLVTDGLIDHYGTSGLGCFGQRAVCIVTNSTFRGDGPLSAKFQAGILIRAEATAVITGNTITDHVHTQGHGQPNWSVGIFLVFADSSSNRHLLRDNTFANNQLDVQRLASAAAWD